MRRILILALLLSCAPSLRAQTRTFFIDYLGGSNANDGLASTLGGGHGPWKTHPYMNHSLACDNAVGPTYTHVAGDHFNFKGGVTWPNACLQINVPSGKGGSSVSVQDYYGVDLTYFTGASFTRPIFDGQNATVTGGPMVKLGTTVQWVTFDNLELKRLMVAQQNATCHEANMDLGGSGTGNILVKNLFIHDWTIAQIIDHSTSHNTGAICQNGGSGGVNLDNVEMSDQNPAPYSTNLGTKSDPFGACWRNLREIKNSKCHHVAEGEVGLFGEIHGNQIHDLDGVTIQQYDSCSTGCNHTNVLETSGFAGEGPIHDNLIYNTNDGVTTFLCPGTDFFSNVMWNNSNASIMYDTGTSCAFASNSTVSNILNNTVDCSNGNNCFKNFFRTTCPAGGCIAAIFNVRDNNWVSNNTPNPVCVNSPTTCANANPASVIGSNIILSTATAQQQGYTTANFYQPTTASNSTVGVVPNLTSSCSGGLAALCTTSSAGNSVPTKPRRVLGNWDAGAYQFSSSTITPPSAPSGLSVSVSGSTASFVWVASTGPIVGYTLYRGTVHNGPYAIVKSGITTPSTTDTPANGTYFYVVTAFNGGVVGSITGNGTTATVTCAAACSFPSGVQAIIGGNSVGAFNGTFTVTSQPTATTFTFASATSSTGTGGGAWQPPGESAKSNEVQAVVPAVASISISPASLTFLATTVGSSSATQTVTVTNTSGSGTTVTFSSVAFTGTNPGDFSRSTTCTTLSTPGQQCTASVTFTPTAAGARSALLTFTDNASGSPQTISVSGSGVTQAPILTLTPSSHDFGWQLVSTTSTAFPFTLTNSGTGTATISSITPSGDFAVFSTTCGGTLGAGLSCFINVNFTPTATGGRAGSFSVVDNAAGSPHVATLSGTGINTKCQLAGATTLSGQAGVCGP